MIVFSVVGILMASILTAADGVGKSLGEDQPLRRGPAIIEVDIGALPKAALIASPEVRTLLGYTRRPLHLTDGHTMGLFSFSFSAPANWLFLVDCRDMSVERYPMPNNDIGSHGAALGSDGNIYVMAYGTGRAYCFDLSKRAFREIACELPEGEYAWDAIGGRNGRIYFGTYPGAWFGEYDPADGSWAIWKDLVPNTKYTTSMKALEDGRIRFQANGPDLVWNTFDPETREFSASSATEGDTPQPSAPTLPELETAEDTFENPVEVDGRWFSVSRVSSRLYELFADGPPKLRGTLKAKAETLWWLKAQPGALAGVGYYGACFRYDLATETLQDGQLDNRAAGGNSIMFVEAISPTCIVGANYSQQNLFTVNPQTGMTMSSLAKIAKVPGEAMCAVGLDGVAYLGIYIQSVFAAYDPAKPLVYGENPRELAHLGPKYQQTRPRAAVTDGTRVYFTSDSDYSCLGGALVVHTPASEKVDVYHQVIPDQNLPTLVYDGGQKLLWGGTDRWGQMKSAPPTQPSALLYAFDPGSREVVHTMTPWAGADVVNVHGVTKNGVLLASHGNEVACIDTRTREVLYQGAWPASLGRDWRLGMDGYTYGLSQGVLYRWDSDVNTLEAVGVSVGATMLTESEPGVWMLADATSVYRLRLAAGAP